MNSCTKLVWFWFSIKKLDNSIIFQKPKSNVTWIGTVVRQLCISSKKRHFLQPAVG
jgi:hypothetical protein